MKNLFYDDISSNFENIVCNKYKKNDYCDTSFSILDLFKLRNDKNVKIYHPKDLMQVFFCNWDEQFICLWSDIKSFIIQNNHYILNNFDVNINPQERIERKNLFNNLNVKFVTIDLRLFIIKTIEAKYA